MKFKKATSCFLLCLSTYTLGADDDAQSVTLCELLAHQKQFNHKRVHLRVRVESMVIEGGTWLVDDSCSSRRIELSVPDSIRNHPNEHPDFKALDDAIRLHGNVGTVDKTVAATFTGKFETHSRKPKLQLVLEKVEDLEVKMLATP